MESTAKLGEPTLAHAGSVVLVQQGWGGILGAVGRLVVHVVPPLLMRRGPSHSSCCPPTLRRVSVLPLLLLHLGRVPLRLLVPRERVL